MQNIDSQRWVVVELLELIANQLASYSHHSELYHSLQTDIQHPELFTEWMIQEMIEKSAWHYSKMIELLDARRKSMRLLKDMAKEYDWDFHCLMKHSIASYQFAQELLNNDMDNMDYIELAEYEGKYMYECASKYLGTDIVTCGRCLADSLAESK